jgi:hypothetical protein
MKNPMNKTIKLSQLRIGTNVRHKEHRDTGVIVDFRKKDGRPIVRWSYGNSCCTLQCPPDNLEVIAPPKTPYEQGQEDYKNGLSFFNNPFFETKNEAGIKEWSDGWGNAQVEKYVQNHPKKDEPHE